MPSRHYSLRTSLCRLPRLLAKQWEFPVNSSKMASFVGPTWESFASLVTSSMWTSQIVFWQRRRATATWIPPLIILSDSEPFHLNWPRQHTHGLKVSERAPSGLRRPRLAIAQHIGVGTVVCCALVRASLQHFAAGAKPCSMVLLL